MVKLDKKTCLILIADIIYLLIFGFIFLRKGNLEFLVYVLSIFLLLFLIGLLHIKFNFSAFTLAGLSFVGLLHMMGGAIIVNGLRLYGHYLVLGVLRYDKIIHFLGIFFAVFLLYEMIKSQKINKWALSLILILAGIGIGAIHEIIEFILVVVLPETGVGGYENTMGDLISNAVGSIVAVVLIWFRKNP